MATPRLYTGQEPSDAKADLHGVLDAWHHATVRLEQTHEMLRQEVRRLNDELESKNRELARLGHLAELGDAAAHVIHDLRERAEPVTMYVSMLRQRLSQDSSYSELIEKLSHAVASLDASVNDLAEFTTNRVPLRRTIELRQLLEETLESLAPQLTARHIRIDLDVPAVHQLFADREMLRRCIVNLSLNAIDAMPAGGELVITSYSGPHGFELEIADSGTGLTDQIRRRMFEPFFTTKHNAAGLGLAIVSRIAEAHGGDLTARNCPEGGAAFTLRIPASQHIMKAAA
ncbi:MAG TPA: HAMP domain-containing sensor histidine kinase [Pirellulales bacterium]